MLVLLLSLLFVSTLVESYALTNLSISRLGHNHENRQKRQTFNGFQFVDCVLPPQPANGKWEVLSGNGKSGTTILPNTLIRFTCNPGYILEPKIEFVLCDIGWNPKNMPRCEESCPALKSSLTTTWKCFDKQGTATSCNKLSHGSMATATCSAFHEISTRQERSIYCVYNKWSDPLPNCEPICGQSVNDVGSGIQPGGTKVERPKSPWTVVIYEKNETGNFYLCSGTLISLAHVLTVAHCVADEYGESKPAKDYQIGAGKSYSAYGDQRDLNAQYVDVGTIIVHPQYRGETQRFFRDIAILKTKRAFRISQFVQPVCFKGLNSITLTDGATGTIALWARQSDGTTTEEAKYTEVTKNDKECENKLPQNWAEKFKMVDKTCIPIEKLSQTICTGYSGTGWTFINPIDNRHYLHGIISLAPYNVVTRCAERPALCTNVSHYYNFIKENMAFS